MRAFLCCCLGSWTVQYCNLNNAMDLFLQFKLELLSALYYDRVHVLEFRNVLTSIASVF